jgi:hypothetical protein
VHQYLDFADRSDQPFTVAPRRSKAMTDQRGVQISRGAITNEFEIEDVDAHYRLAGGPALKETAKALYVRKFRHRWSVAREQPSFDRAQRWFQPAPVVSYSWIRAWSSVCKSSVGSSRA